MNLARCSLLPVFAFAAALTYSGAAGAQTFEGEGVNALLEGLGLVDTDKPDIDFKERGPLVIPSEKDLPPPAAPRTAGVDPNWPVDPDELKKRNEDTAQIWIEQTRQEPTLKGKELQGYTLPAGQTNHSSGTPTSDRARITLTPGEMAKSHKLLAKQESWAEAGEPERKVLSDPPPGYRAPVTSAPYQAAPTAKDTFWDKINIFKPK